jgi:hypothetical protein
VQLPLALPGLLWGVTAIACGQAIVIIGLRLVALARKDKFEDDASGWLHAIVGCLLVFIVLVVLAITTLAAKGYRSPATPELVVVGVLALIVSPGHRCPNDCRAARALIVPPVSVPSVAPAGAFFVNDALGGLSALRCPDPHPASLGGC